MVHKTRRVRFAPVTSTHMRWNLLRPLVTTCVVSAILVSELSVLYSSTGSTYAAKLAANAPLIQTFTAEQGDEQNISQHASPDSRGYVQTRQGYISAFKNFTTPVVQHSSTSRTEPVNNSATTFVEDAPTAASSIPPVRTYGQDGRLENATEGDDMLPKTPPSRHQAPPRHEPVSASRSTLPLPEMKPDSTHNISAASTASPTLPRSPTPAAAPSSPPSLSRAHRALHPASPTPQAPPIAPGTLPARFAGVPLPPGHTDLYPDADNTTRVSYMLYRLIRTHALSSLLDTRCAATRVWMPQLLHYLDYEVPGFRYYCIVADEAERNAVSASFGDQASPEFIIGEEYWRLHLPQVDVAFLWTVLGYVTPTHAWQLMKTIRKSSTKYIVIPNFPNVRNNPAAATQHGRVNVRRAPYRFTQALRVFHNVSLNEGIVKQMLFYDVEHLRSDDSR